MDISGELQRDISHDLIKARLTAAGTAVPGSQIAELRNDIDKMSEQHSPDYCGSCYGRDPPEGGCCKSCDAVRIPYTRKGWSFGNPGESSMCEFLSSRLVPFPSRRVQDLRGREVRPRTLV